MSIFFTKLFTINIFLSLHRLLIGAPKARALSNQGANITGGLYSCDITTHPDDCTRVDFDNDGKQKNPLIASKNLCTRDLTISHEDSGAVDDCCREYNMLFYWFKHSSSQQCQDFLIDLEILIVTWFLFTATITVDVLVENKENQWMGVTVQSQGPGGKIVVRQVARGTC